MSEPLENPEEIADNKSLLDDDDNEIQFDFIKSNYFRVIHGDGAFGGITPHGNIHIGIFSERSPIPKSVVHAANPDGTIGPEIRDRRASRKSIVREIEVDIVMNLTVAKNFHEWLADRIKLAEDMLHIGEDSQDEVPGKET